jgi:hypothetical protein
MKNNESLFSTGQYTGSNLAALTNVNYNKQEPAITNRVRNETDLSKKIVFISFTNKLWNVYTVEKNIGKSFLLKSTAIAAAVKYVTMHPEGSFLKIEILGNLGRQYTYWSLGADAFPPQKKANGTVVKNSK